VKAVYLWVWVGLLGGMLSGCTSSGQDELREWMQSERSTIQPQVKPIAEPTKFVPQRYMGERLLDPFSDEKLASLLKSSDASPAVNSALSACIKAPLIPRAQQSRLSCK